MLSKTRVSLPAIDNQELGIDHSFHFGVEREIIFDFRSREAHWQTQISEREGANLTSKHCH